MNACPGEDISEKSVDVLVVDDEDQVRAEMTYALQGAGYTVVGVDNGNDAVTVVQQKAFDLALVDVNMPGLDGFQTLLELKHNNPALAVVMVTGYGTVQDAIDALKSGADDFILKPFGVNAVRELVRDILNKKETRRRLSDYDLQSTGDRPLLTQAPRMLAVMDLVDQIAPLPSTVLIEGESGTGKELIARRIFQHSEAATHGRFVGFNCAVIPQNLLESELFGYEKGAFTGATSRKIGYFEAASKGTLFIDEISEMSPDLQTRLLRILQERTFRRVGGIEEVDFTGRIIAATNRRLEELVSAGSFRTDLYYRINVLKIVVPPLRERPEDIPLLSQFFIDRYAKLLKKEVSGCEPAALDRLVSHRWEGNVRELQNAIERAVAIAHGPTVTLSDLSSEFFRSIIPTHDDTEVRPFKEAKSDFELKYLKRALEAARGNVAHASRMTGISRQHLYDKLARHGLEQAGYRSAENEIA